MTALIKAFTRPKPGESNKKFIRIETPEGRNLLKRRLAITREQMPRGTAGVSKNWV